MVEVEEEGGDGGRGTGTWDMGHGAWMTEKLSVG